MWEAKATVDSGGWTAEYRIPFSQVRFNPRVATWGIQLERIIGRRKETIVRGGFQIFPRERLK